MNNQNWCKWCSICDGKGRVNLILGMFGGKVCPSCLGDGYSDPYPEDKTYKSEDTRPFPRLVKELEAK